MVHLNQDPMIPFDTIVTFFTKFGQYHLTILIHALSTKSSTAEKSILFYFGELKGI